MSAHTPGKWHLIRACEKDGSAIATIEASPETMDEPNYWTVAHVNTLREEWAANARLMKEAPALYEAAQEFVKWAEASGHRAQPGSPVAKAREAIARIHGERK